jgi:membrane-associated phospholipid phosphatase
MNESIISLSQAESLPFLSAIFAWGIDVIKTIQGIQSPGLTAFMKIMTSLGTEYVYIVIVLLIFWCRDEKKGFRLGMLILVSAWVNAVFKTFLDQPRPYEFVPALALAFEPTRAFPSGHAQMSMTFWGAIASWLSYSLAKGSKKFRPVIWAVSGLVILLIGVSRLYLGVHFPTDVLGGWIMALIVLGLFFVLEKKATPLLQKTRKRIQFIIAAVAALIMNALHPEDTSLSAMVLGFCVGYSLMISSFPFAASSSAIKIQKRVAALCLRFALGITVAAIIYFGLRLVIPGKDSLFKSITFFEPFYELGRFIRYGLLGFWASAGAPWLFLKIGIAQAAPSDNAPELPKPPEEAQAPESE